MLSLAQFRCGAVNPAARIDQFLGFQHITAPVALIGTGSFKSADVAGAFHIAVREKFFRGGRVPLHGFLRVKKTILLERQENGLRDLEMVFRMGGGKEVVGNADLLEQVNEASVIFFVDFFNRLAFFVGGNCDRRPVRIGA